MSNQSKRFETDEELFEYLDESGLGDRLIEGYKQAFEEYLELGGAKLKSITFSQSRKSRS